MSMPAVAGHEGLLELDLYYAHSCRVTLSSSFFFLCLNVLLSIFDILQAVDEFVCELRLREMNPEKQCKIAALALDEEEWTWVHLFSNILQVHLLHILCFPPYLHSFFSMPTIHSKLFPQAQDQLFTMRCQHWRGCMPSGRRPQIRDAMRSVDKYMSTLSGSNGLKDYGP